MKNILLLIIFVQILCYSQFSGGSGTVEDPYQIATAEQLDQVRNYKTSCFIQTSDIDLGVAPWNEGEGWQPIAKYIWSDPTQSFRGNYNGNGYSITNLYINKPSESFLGLFASTDSAELRNITLLNLNIIGGTCIGGISGNTNYGSISNCNVYGNIEGIGDIGLLMYMCEVDILENCHTGGEIIASRGWVGGMITINLCDSVVNCTSDVNITTGDSYMVGGLFGQSMDTQYMENCRSNANINSKSIATGGLIGAFQNFFDENVKIKNCYATGTLIAPIDSTSTTGGLIGGLSAYENITISNCYSTVDVTGNDRVGGFIGGISKNAIIENCYSSGSVYGNIDTGGFIGKIDSLDNVSIINSYWDTDTSGLLISAAGEGRTTAEMTYPYSGSTYVNWDFDTVWRDDIADQNDGYPTFLWVSRIEDDQDCILPETATLYQNYPNPFNPVTYIRFSLQVKSDVKLSVFNSKGELVKTLFEGKEEKGAQTVKFDASDLNSGLYFYKLSSNNINLTRKMLLLK